MPRKTRYVKKELKKYAKIGNPYPSLRGRPVRRSLGKRLVKAGKSVLKSVFRGPASIASGLVTHATAPGYLKKDIGRAMRRGTMTHTGVTHIKGENATARDSLYALGNLKARRLKIPAMRGAFHGIHFTPKKDMSTKTRGSLLSTFRHEAGHSRQSKASRLFMTRKLTPAQQRTMKVKSKGYDPLYRAEMDAWRRGIGMSKHGNIHRPTMDSSLYTYATSPQEHARGMKTLDRYQRMVRFQRKKPALQRIGGAIKRKIGHFFRSERGGRF